MWLRVANPQEGSRNRLERDIRADYQLGKIGGFGGNCVAFARYWIMIQHLEISSHYLLPFRISGRRSEEGKRGFIIIRTPLVMIQFTESFRRNKCCHDSSICNASETLNMKSCWGNEKKPITKEMPQIPERDWSQNRHSLSSWWILDLLSSHHEKYVSQEAEGFPCFCESRL